MLGDKQASCLWKVKNATGGSGAGKDVGRASQNYSCKEGSGETTRKTGQG